jgi:hypothetical protein
MGRRAERKRRFLDAHPLCCFCGGTTAAATIDHIPARGLFLGRVWPDGYEFPACEACNAGASDDELMMAVAVRVLLFRDPSSTETQELENALSGLKYRLPHVLKKFRESSRVQARRFLRERGIETTNGGTELFVMHVPEEIQSAAMRYGAKLAKALHYKHTGQIAKCTAAVKVKVMTNADLMAPTFPLESLSVLTNGAVIQRGVTSLKGQFDYRFAITEDARASAFWALFGESTAMLLAVFSDSQEYEQHKAARLAARAGGLSLLEGLDQVT